jgi:hypothetical protein
MMVYFRKPLLATQPEGFSPQVNPFAFMQVWLVIDQSV